MISAIDRLYGNRGGEALAVLSLISVSLWVTYHEMPAAHAWFDHTCATADLVIRNLRSHICGYG